MKFFYKALDFLFTVTNKIVEFTVKYPFLIALLVIVIIFAIVVLLVRKNTNVGGLIGKLLSFLQTGDPIELANSIPKDREQALGEADSRGFVQHEVKQLERSLNPFRDRSKIVLPNGKEVKLPRGISDVDIDVIIEADTEVIVVPSEEAHKRALGVQETIKKAQNTNSSAKDLLARLKAKENA